MSGKASTSFAQALHLLSETPGSGGLLQLNTHCHVSTHVEVSACRLNRVPESLSEADEMLTLASGGADGAAPGERETRACKPGGG
jgi:hypothetical protein